MIEEKLRRVCESNGCSLLGYTQGRSATLILASGEKVILSAGTSTFKVFAKRGAIGWLLPRTLGSKKLSDWLGESYNRRDFRYLSAVVVAMQGVIILLSRCKSLNEVEIAWPELPNPVGEMALHEILQG